MISDSHSLLRLFFFNAPATTEIYTLPYTTLFRSLLEAYFWIIIARAVLSWVNPDPYNPIVRFLRSEEHTSELQSHSDLVCRLLLEKKKNIPPLPHTQLKTTYDNH